MNARTKERLAIARYTLPVFTGRLHRPPPVNAGVILDTRVRVHTIPVNTVTVYPA